MRPIFVVHSLTWDVDLTLKLMDRTTRLELVDAEGVESDTLELDIDDRAGEVDVPEQGEILRVYLGYSGRELAHMGDYVIDEIGLEGPPMTMSISGKGVDVVGSALKAPKSKTRRDEAETVGTLARAIAEEHGLEPTIHPEVDNIPVRHIDQVGESDMALLQRLAGLHDLTLRVAARALTLRPHAARLSIGEALLGGLVVREGKQLSRYRWRGKARTRYEGVRSHYYDPERAERVPVVVGAAGEDALILDERHDCRDEDEATRSGTSRMHQLGRETASLSIDMPGDEWIRAGARLFLHGIRDPIHGHWSIETVRHRLDRNGFTTSVEAVPPLDRLIYEGALPALLGGAA